METGKKELAAFLERIEKRMSESGTSHRGRHRVAFTALQPLTEHAVALGYTMKAVWAALRDENELSMTYETFRAYCRRAGIGARTAATNLAEEAPRGFRGGRGSRKGDLN